MSASGRAAEFMRAWGEGHNKPHNPDHRQWGADDCDACTAEAFEPWEALLHAAWIMGWGLTYGVVRKLCQDWEDAAAPMRISVAASSVRACARDLRALLARCSLDGDPAGSDTGVADSDRGDSSGTNLRPTGRCTEDNDRDWTCPCPACPRHEPIRDDSSRLFRRRVGRSPAGSGRERAGRPSGQFDP